MPWLSTGANVNPRLSNNRGGQALISVVDAKPGDRGTSRVWLENTSRHPVRMMITQDRVVDTGFSRSLRLNIHDDTRNYCVYPLQNPGPCKRYGLWAGAETLELRTLRSLRGYRYWKRGERHSFTIGWRLAPASRPTDAGQHASFRLVWRAYS